MKFHRAGLNLIIILAICLIGLLGDLYLFLNAQPTISQMVWDVNRWTLWPVVFMSVLLGHFCTVPK